MKGILSYPWQAAVSLLVDSQRPAIRRRGFGVLISLSIGWPQQQKCHDILAT